MNTSTKQKLIQAAIILFAQNDIESTSVQTINEAAGVANKSALYYHFKNRWGLVEAALNHILIPYTAETKSLLEALDPNELTVDRVVDALMRPMIKILLAEHGFHALKFFSRMVSASDQSRQLIAHRLAEISIHAVQLLTKALPGSNPNTISIKVLFTFNSILNIISDNGLEKYWPTEVKDHRAIAQYLRDYIIGAIQYNNHILY